MAPQTRLHRAGPGVILALARRQHGVVSRVQLLQLGLTDGAIRHRVRNRVLHPVHRGVFAAGRPDLPQEGRWLAAVLACGDGAVLSHLSAAVLWGIYEKPPPVRSHVTVPTQAGLKGSARLVIHRSATLVAAQITELRRIPVTTLARTLIDLAGVLSGVELRSALRQAERRGLNLRAFAQWLEGFPATAFRPARLRRLLSHYVPGTELTESVLEESFLALCSAHRIPLPTPQVRMGRYRADFLWKDVRLVVETDGRQSHDGFIAFREDRVKDRALSDAGYEVKRFTWSEVTGSPRGVADELLRAIRRRACELGVESS